MRPRSYLLVVLVILIAILSIISLRGIAEGFAINQLFFFLFGLVVFFITSAVPFRIWQNGRWLWYFGVIGLLLLTLIMGRATKGAVSWLHFGAYRLQPSELLKPTLLLLLASEFTVGHLQHTKPFLKFALLAGFPLLLVMLQPDLGTAITVIAGVGTLFLLENPPPKLVLGLGGLAILVLTVSWLWLLQPYQKDRILTFVRPTQDTQGSGYNAQQAMIAVGSGGLWGQGWGQGKQSHLRFLPERQTDFLFATFAEERGWVGSVVLVGLYAALFIAMGAIAQSITNSHQRIFLYSSGALLLFQSFINIGMNIGLTPVTGIPLPLFSLGGSSILATCITLGLVESIRRSQLPATKSIS